MGRRENEMGKETHWKVEKTMMEKSRHCRDNLIAVF